MQIEFQRPGYIHDSGLHGSQGWEGVSDRRCWINEQGRGCRETPFQPEERKEGEEAKERLKCFIVSVQAASNIKQDKIWPVHEVI